ncbi:MAG TPA: NAD(P)/FAD-dependent oxidoreductase [Thermoleophilaceae bacterium]|nr:NAD(P)/FAD-dependent oxidoreductase [Thermoleophilaceae bacterium]
MTPTTDVDVLIVGSGFSGLGMAIRLKQEGMTDFTVLERADDVGGTWQANTYPGCACDVPSHLYSFSFAPNPGWSQTYSPQPEIWDYLRDTARRYDVLSHVRFGNTVTSAEWDEETARWKVETDRGPFTARVFIPAMGPLAAPKKPDVPGLDSFEGTIFHSAEWNHDHDLTGERVASIGTGASAIQYVPSIQPKVSRLHVFQRTAPWVMPHSNRKVTGVERRLYRAFPALQRLVRGLVYSGREILVLGFVKRPKLLKQFEKVARRHMRGQISDPELLRKVTPDYTIGCKRILPSNQWYPALDQPNVELVTDEITEVRPHSVVTADGTEREVDTIILGTGFSVSDMPVARQVRGRDGKLMVDGWEGGSPCAHLGTAMPGFPNLFMLLGPNTGLGHNSMVYMIESQLAYVIDALRNMRQNGTETVEVKRETVQAYNDRIDEKHVGTVWTTGCKSWYLDDTGRNSTIWPDWTFRFRHRTQRFDPSKYDLRTAPAPEPEKVAA